MDDIDETIEALRRALALPMTPDEARKKLIEDGLILADGSLHPNYRQRDDIDRAMESSGTVED